MEVVSSNDGLLTNIEVLEILKENRERRGNANAVKIDLQNRENVEVKVCDEVSWNDLTVHNASFSGVTQAIKYVSGTAIGHLSSSTVGECIKKIKALNLGLTEGEIVQIANLAPESDVELYLASLP